MRSFNDQTFPTERYSDGNDLYPKDTYNVKDNTHKPEEKNGRRINFIYFYEAKLLS